MRYTLHPDAESDPREAAAFYREQADNALALSFLGEFESSIDMLLRHPGLGALWRHRKRRYGMRRFPYSLVYSVAGDEIRILAIAHHSRRPGYWSGRK